MSMILIYDLDDTLYPEITYVHSGFRAVAEWAHTSFGWSVSASMSSMKATLAAEGRGRVFDRLLEEHAVHSRSAVARCVAIYRSHRPVIRLFPAARALLDTRTDPMYIVTDGNKLVQQSKIRALGLEARVRRAFITHRYGIRHAKPSLHCFERIRRLEHCDWRDMVYVGDNPAKDFVSLNRTGALTVRVLTGMHRQAHADRAHDARHTIATLRELPALLSRRAQASRRTRR